MKQKNLKHKECVTNKTIYQVKNCESENSTQWIVIFKLEYSNLVSTAVRSREHGRNEVGESAEENLQRKRVRKPQTEKNPHLNWISNQHVVTRSKEYKSRLDVRIFEE
jgi:hypothetical protein